jgi:hypothetical protein
MPALSHGIQLSCNIIAETKTLVRQDERNRLLESSLDWLKARILY